VLPTFEQVSLIYMRIFYTIECSVWVENFGHIKEIQFKHCHWY